MKFWQKIKNSIFKPSRLILDKTPESSTDKISSEDKKNIEKLKKIGAPLAKLSENVISSMTGKAKRISEKAEERKSHEETIKIINSTFYKNYSKERTPDQEAKLEELRLQAESYDVSINDLRGGYEWLGIKNEENYSQKFEILAKMYLNVEEKNGQIIYTVKPELNRNDKVKLKLGAGHIFPSTYRELTVVDNFGNARTGTRDIRNGNVGYYDAQGYIPIYAGYKIIPKKIIAEKNEKSEKGKFYQDHLNEELANYRYLETMKSEAEDYYQEQYASTYRGPVPQKQRTIQDRFLETGHKILRTTSLLAGINWSKYEKKMRKQAKKGRGITNIRIDYGSPDYPYLVDRKDKQCANFVSQSTIGSKEGTVGNLYARYRVGLQQRGIEAETVTR